MNIETLDIQVSSFHSLFLIADDQSLSGTEHEIDFTVLRNFLTKPSIDLHAEWKPDLKKIKELVKLVLENSTVPQIDKFN